MGKGHSVFGDKRHMMYSYVDSLPLAQFKEIRTQTLDIFSYRYVGRQTGRQVGRQCAKCGIQPFSGYVHNVHACILQRGLTLSLPTILPSSLPSTLPFTLPLHEKLTSYSLGELKTEICINTSSKTFMYA